MEKIIIHFDGASKGNPGISGAGWHISATNYSKKGYEYLGKKTNNQAEYTALLRALEIVEKDFEQLSNVDLVIKGDSQLAIRQLQGEYKVKSPNLIELYTQVTQIIDKIGKKEYLWIPRDENSIADEQANIAINFRQKLARI